jgi:hypothetical protein
MCKYVSLFLMSPNHLIIMPIVHLHNHRADSHPPRNYLSSFKLKRLFGQLATLVC